MAQKIVLFARIQPPFLGLKKENRDRLFVSEEKHLFFPEDPQWHLDELTLPRLFDEEGKLPPDYPKSHYGYGWGVVTGVPRDGDDPRAYWGHPRLSQHHLSLYRHKRLRCYFEQYSG